MDHTLLEYDEATRTAIAFTTPASRTPFVVCSGYDRERGEWGAGSYFPHVLDAAARFERDCGRTRPGLDGRLREDEFCTIRWTRADVAGHLACMWPPVPATEKNLNAAISMIGGELESASVARGWDAIDDLVDGRKLDLGLGKAGDEALRDLYAGTSLYRPDDGRLILGTLNPAEFLDVRVCFEGYEDLREAAGRSRACAFADLDPEPRVLEAVTGKHRRLRDLAREVGSDAESGRDWVRIDAGDALSDVVAKCDKVVPDPARRRGGAGAGPRL